MRISDWSSDVCSSDLGVARPGIYELRGSATVGAILDYAGGAVRPRGSSVSISRIKSDGGEAFVQVTGVEQPIIAGDALVVASGSAGGPVNRVTLHGQVTLGRASCRERGRKDV